MLSLLLPNGASCAISSCLNLNRLGNIAFGRSVFSISVSAGGTVFLAGSADVITACKPSRPCEAWETRGQTKGIHDLAAIDDSSVAVADSGKFLYILRNGQLDTSFGSGGFITGTSRYPLDFSGIVFADGIIYIATRGGGLHGVSVPQGTFKHIGFQGHSCDGRMGTYEDIAFDTSEKALYILDTRGRGCVTKIVNLRWQSIAPVQ